MTTINNQDEKIIAPLGQTLQDARQAASLSVDDVAEQLNLGEQTVRDIEGYLEQIIANKKYPAIYLRGYLVNYAKLVAVDNIGQFIEYQQLSVSQNKQKSLRSSMIIHPVKKRARWLWLLLILIIAGISFSVAQQLPFFTIENVVAKVAEIKATTEDAIVNSDESVAELKSSSTAPLDVQSADHEEILANAELNTIDTAVSGNESVVETVVATKVVTKVASRATIAKPVAADAQLNEAQKLQDDAFIQKTPVVADVPKVVDKALLIDRQPQPLKKVQHNESLKLSFSGACWTEIFDATGKRLAFNLYKKGALLTVHGPAPFKVKLGDPSIVEIQYQDKIVEREFISGHTVTFRVPQKL